MHKTQPIWKRITADVIWIVFVLILALLISYFSATDKQTWSWSANVWVWIISTAVGLVLGERQRAWRWTVNVIRAARILVQEDDNPKEFIFPRAEIEFYPDRATAINPDYVHVDILWLNMLYRTAVVENITGKFSLDGAIPADEFNHRKPLQLKPHDWTKTEIPITVNIKHYNFEAITKMREAKRANGNLSIELSFELDGQLVQKTINQKYLYVG